MSKHEENQAQAGTDTPGKSKRPREKAVALRYRPDEDAAPVVVASGHGQIADRIIGIAEEKGIPVFRDDSAASMLCMLQVGQGIPEELYQVIAAIYLQLLKTAHQIKTKGSPIGRQPGAAAASPRPAVPPVKGVEK